MKKRTDDPIVLTLNIPQYSMNDGKSPNYAYNTEILPSEQTGYYAPVLPDYPDKHSSSNPNEDLETDKVITLSCFNEINLENKSSNTVLKKERLESKGSGKFIQYRELQDFEEKYPLSTDICCWWCAYPFRTRAIGLPVKRQDRNFFCVGCFCSFSCADAYAADRQRYRASRILLRDMYYIYTGYGRSTGTPLRPAPPQSQLDIFGGRLNITQFRQMDDNIFYENYKSPQVPYKIESLISPVYQIPRDIKKSFGKAKLAAPQKRSPKRAKGSSTANLGVESNGSIESFLSFS